MKEFKLMMSMGKKDNNINFIVLEAMAAAKMKAKKGDQAAKNKKQRRHNGR